MYILSARRFALWFQLFKQWLTALLDILKEAIIGKPETIECTTIIPSCSCEWGNSILGDDNDYEVYDEAIIPSGFGVGSVVMCDSLTDYDLYVATAVSDEVALNYDGNDRLLVTGATWAIIKANTRYLCKDSVELSTEVDGETINLTLYIYEEYKPKTIEDVFSEISHINIDTTEVERKIMGADSQATWDTGVSIPAASFDSGSFNCIVRDDDKYWLGYNEDVAGTDDILVGDVCRASEVDAENGYKICTNYVSPSPILFGNVAKSGDAYYLLYGTGTAFTAVEANKNYRCKEIVNLEYVPNPLQPSSTITGKIYIWEEYEGESIKDGVEEIKDFVAEEAAGINANISDIQTLIGYTISEIDGI